MGRRTKEALDRWRQTNPAKRAKKNKDGSSANALNDMSGGVYDPPSDRREWANIYSAIAADYAAGTPAYLSENATVLRRLYLDVDIHRRLTEAEIGQLSMFLREHVLAFGCGSSMFVFLSQNSTDQGLHYYFPDIVCDASRGGMVSQWLK